MAEKALLHSALSLKTHCFTPHFHRKKAQFRFFSKYAVYCRNTQFYSGFMPKTISLALPFADIAKFDTTFLLKMLKTIQNAQL
jgi:hypothetical protein